MFRKTISRWEWPLVTVALSVLATACGGDPQTSSSSHWVRCAATPECAGVPGAVSCLEGWCVDAEGTRLKTAHGKNPMVFPAGAGNPGGACPLPPDAVARDTTTPTHVIGDGTPASCTSDAVVSTIAKGGIITFDCGPEPVVIELEETAKIVNDTGPDIVIDGGGKVTLSGGGRHRILYQNTCDEAQKWTTEHCNDQDHPRLVVQNLTFVHGNAEAEEDGGGAIFARGGRLAVINSRFFGNRCAATGPNVGGGAIRCLDQSQGLPAFVADCTFGGAAGLGNVGSNGGALSTIGASYQVVNSVLTHNQAVGFGAEPPRAGTPGGGSGGAIFTDGNTYTLELCGARLEDNHAREGGGAIFFVSNDLTGALTITDSTLRRNPSDGFETTGYPGIFVQAKHDPLVTNSIIE